MNASLNGNEPGLAGYWPISTGSGSTLFDFSKNSIDGQFFLQPTWLTTVVGMREDCNRNGNIDECEPDTNGDGLPDNCSPLANCGSGDLDSDDLTTLLDLALFTDLLLRPECIPLGKFATQT